MNIDIRRNSGFLRGFKTKVEYEYIKYIISSK